MADEMIHIVYGSDNNYWFPTAVSAASAVYFAEQPEKIVLHLFDAGVTDENYAQYCEMIHRVSKDVKLERHVLSAAMFAGYGAWRGSVVTYSRMYLADILRDIDWAIYVDGDTLWLGDPAALWALRDETMLVQASLDPPPTDGGPNLEFAWYREHGLEMEGANYLCMGLMMANLKAMREEKIPEKCQEFMQRFNAPRIVDQTVLNWVCKGRMRALPRNWGVFSVWHRGVDLSEPSIVHYCQDCPWQRKKVNRLFSDVVLLWFEFCKRVLGMDELAKFSRWTHFWRRGLFVVLHYLPFLVCIHPWIHARLRNIHGIPRDEYARILKKFDRRKGVL